MTKNPARNRGKKPVLSVKAMAKKLEKKLEVLAQEASKPSAKNPILLVTGGLQVKLDKKTDYRAQVIARKAKQTVIDLAVMELDPFSGREW